MELRSLTLEEVPLCLPHGPAFMHEMQVPWAFNPDSFLAHWQALYGVGKGEIFGVWQDSTVIAGLGAMEFIETHCGMKMAIESFWFTSSSARGTTAALRLLNRFESWASERGCVETWLAHLVGPRAEQLDRIYRKRGYGPIETIYRKVIA